MTWLLVRMKLQSNPEAGQKAPHFCFQSLNLETGQGKHTYIRRKPMAFQHFSCKSEVLNLLSIRVTIALTNLGHRLARHCSTRRSEAAKELCARKTKMLVLPQVISMSHPKLIELELPQYELRTVQTFCHRCHPHRVPSYLSIHVESYLTYHHSFFSHGNSGGIKLFVYLVALNDAPLH